MANSDPHAEPATTPTATTTAPGSQIGFLDLPSEIRLQIYHYTFDRNRVSISVRSIRSDHSNTANGNDYSRILYNPLSRFTPTYRLFGPQVSRPYILLTCRTIFKECWSVVLDNVELHYGISTSILQTSGHDAASSTEQGSISDRTQVQGEDVWAKHVTHGSNILLLSNDLMKIKRICDSVQMSYTHGFRSVIILTTPNIEVLTVRRNWDAISGQHSGKHKDINLTIDYKYLAKTWHNDNLAFLGVYAPDGVQNGAPNEAWLSDMLILSTASSREPTAPCETRSYFSYGTIWANIHDMVWAYQHEDRKERERYKVQGNDDHSDSIFGDPRSWSSFLLRRSLRSRGFRVHMALTFDLFIKNMVLDPKLLNNPLFINNAECIDQDQKPRLLAKWTQNKDTISSRALGRPNTAPRQKKQLKTTPVNTNSSPNPKVDKRQAVSAAKAAWLAANPAPSPSASPSRFAPTAQNLKLKATSPPLKSHSTNPTDKHVRFDLPNLEPESKRIVLELGLILYAKIDVKYDFDTLKIVEVKLNRVPIR